MAIKVLYMVLAARGQSRSFLRKALKDFHITKPAYEKPLFPTIVDYSTSASKFISKIKENFKFNSPKYSRNINLLQLSVFRTISSQQR